MKEDMTDHLGILALGHLWNHPIMQLNNLLSGETPDGAEPDPALRSALLKLSAPEKQALKKAITNIFASDLIDFCAALDETARNVGLRELGKECESFSNHLPPWNDDLSYFDEDGEPKKESDQ